ncbi:MAG: squalene--hopene cyclase [Phycisphaerales bacterium]|nr:squalene--hopene cyclase [Phycisphaerales bacterium]
MSAVTDPPFKVGDELDAAVALDRAVEALVSLQREDGHWCALLQGDSILESEYLLMKFILEQEEAPLRDGSGRETLDRIAAGLRAQQRSDGTWGQYPGAEMDLSATVKGYFALKLMGDDPEAAHMTAAREAVLAGGGAERVNTFSRFYLACLGQVSWDAVPAIPPEIVLLPRWFYFHLDKVSAWTRTMVVPLAIVTCLRPTRALKPEQGIDELFVDHVQRHKLGKTVDAPSGWSAFFSVVDRCLKVAHKFGGTPVRKAALRRCRDWMLERASQKGEAATEGLGAIFPPMVYMQIALKAMGWSRSHEVIQQAEHDLDALFVDQDDEIRIQPCFSPVWDTGYALSALGAAGRGCGDAEVDAAVSWLLSKACRFRGDWARSAPVPEDALGWFFEYENAWYPDVDDTAQVAMALRLTGDPAAMEAACRGVKWLVAMQNEDGGWAAFDRSRDRRVLEYVPFADHNAMQDPSCPDITGRVLECLSMHGYSTADALVRRGIDYIKSRQTIEGAFIGRWGVNYIYGTWQSLVGPIRCGVDPGEAWVRRAGRWLTSVQKADGSFGESAGSYLDPTLKGTGPSTASQTAWAAMTLQAVYGRDDRRVVRAINWLIETQLSAEAAADSVRNPDGDQAGSWSEQEFTGTGFPKVFYLRYHLYRLYFPLMALAHFNKR